MKNLVNILLGLVFSASFGIDVTLAAAPPSATQTVTGGNVTVKAIFLNPKSANEPRFQVTLETHSVQLDGYDLKTLAILRDDKGESYLPTAVENKGGGHHREIILTFPKVSPAAKTLKVVIKNVAGVKERSFSWSVE